MKYGCASSLVFFPGKFPVLEVDQPPLEYPLHPALEPPLDFTAGPSCLPVTNDAPPSVAAEAGMGGLWPQRFAQRLPLPVQLGGQDSSGGSNGMRRVSLVISNDRAGGPLTLELDYQVDEKGQLAADGVEVVKFVDGSREDLEHEILSDGSVRLVGDDERVWHYWIELGSGTPVIRTRLMCTPEGVTVRETSRISNPDPVGASQVIEVPFYSRRLMREPAGNEFHSSSSFDPVAGVIDWTLAISNNGEIIWSKSRLSPGNFELLADGTVRREGDANLRYRIATAVIGEPNFLPKNRHEMSDHPSQWKERVLRHSEKLNVAVTALRGPIPRDLLEKPLMRIASLSASVDHAEARIQRPMLRHRSTSLHSMNSNLIIWDFYHANARGERKFHVRLVQNRETAQITSLGILNRYTGKQMPFEILSNGWIRVPSIPDDVFLEIVYDSVPRYNLQGVIHTPDELPGEVSVIRSIGVEDYESLGSKFKLIVATIEIIPQPSLTGIRPVE